MGGLDVRASVVEVGCTILELGATVEVGRPVEEVEAVIRVGLLVITLPLALLVLPYSSRISDDTTSSVALSFPFRLLSCEAMLGAFSRANNLLLDFFLFLSFKIAIELTEICAKFLLQALKEDTIISLDNIETNHNLKVDLRIVQDQIVQKFNKEIDTSVAEATKDDPGIQKFQSDHCKLMVKYIVISNVRLSAPGLYIGDEIFFGSVTNSLSNLEKLLDVAFNLLAFRDSIVQNKSCY
ncbi:hypothetical protein EDC94DRAFT_581879 [Helicostylum pulchrum]|nr:hypothetical protein EDC94DRAFT_581879 [Helicostylum pulchrum]